MQRKPRSSCQRGRNAMRHRRAGDTVHAHSKSGRRCSHNRRCDVVRGVCVGCAAVQEVHVKDQPRTPHMWQSPEQARPTLLRAPDRGSRRRSAAVQLVFDQPAAKVSRQSVSASTSRSSAHPDRDVGSGGLPRSHPLSSGVDDDNHFQDSACSLAGDRVSESVPIMNGRAGAQRMAHKHPMHPHQSGPVRSIHTCMYGHVCAQMICMIPMIPERPDAPLLARIHAS